MCSLQIKYDVLTGTMHADDLLASKVDAIFAAGDFRGCFLEPIQTESIVSPLTRLSKPRTMVSTSGNSGIESEYRRSEVRGQIAEVNPANSDQICRPREFFTSAI